MNYIFHKLVPIKEIQAGWYSLRWKPIRNGTYNIGVSKNMLYKWHWHLKIGVRVSSSCKHNGWGAGYDGFDIELMCLFFTIDFWLHYNHYCMTEGASDSDPMEPLDFSKSKLKARQK